MKPKAIECPDCGTKYLESEVECPHCGLIVEFENSPAMLPPLPIATMFWGSLKANLVGVIAIGINFGLQYLAKGGGASVFTTFDSTVVPMCTGVLCTFFWRHHNLKISNLLLGSLVCGAYAIVAGIAFFAEGGICILMASPLLFGVLLVGMLIGKLVFLSPKPRLNVSLIPLFIVLLVGDGLTSHGYTGVVADTIVVKAPAADVWRYVADFPPITEKQDYWLWKLGVPKPIQSVSTQPWIGGERKCILTNNTVLTERISEMSPNANFTFDVINQKGDLELVHHLTADRGQFLLTQNADGTTTVTGTTWYNLHVFPGWYFNIWATDVIRHVHISVMEHIAHLAEARAAQERAVASAHKH